MIKKPKQAKNYKGELVNIEWPKGKVVLNVGSVYVLCTRSKSPMWSVVYGLQVKENLSYSEACTEFGSCIFHENSETVCANILEKTA